MMTADRASEPSQPECPGRCRRAAGVTRSDDRQYSLAAASIQVKRTLIAPAKSYKHEMTVIESSCPDLLSQLERLELEIGTCIRRHRQRLESEDSNEFEVRASNVHIVLSQRVFS